VHCYQKTAAAAAAVPAPAPAAAAAAASAPVPEEQPTTETMATPPQKVWMASKQCKSPVATWKNIEKRTVCRNKCDAHAKAHGYTSGAFCCAYSPTKERCHVAADNDAEFVKRRLWKRRLLRPPTSTP
jgi:hypothetical protein